MVGLNTPKNPIGKLKKYDMLKGIPKSTKILSNEITVESKHSLVFGELDADGLSHLHEYRIEIDKSSCSDLQESTYYHELVHNIFYASGQTKLNDNEHLVQILGSLIHQFVKTANFISDDYLVPKSKFELFGMKFRVKHVKDLKDEDEPISSMLQFSDNLITMTTNNFTKQRLETIFYTNLMMLFIQISDSWELIKDESFYTWFGGMLLQTLKESKYE